MLATSAHWGLIRVWAEELVIAESPASCTLRYVWAHAIIKSVWHVLYVFFYLKVNITIIYWKITDLAFPSYSLLGYLDVCEGRNISLGEPPDVNNGRDHTRSHVSHRWVPVRGIILRNNISLFSPLTSSRRSRSCYQTITNHQITLTISQILFFQI